MYLHFTIPQTVFLYFTQPEILRRHSFLETLVKQYTDFTVNASLYGIPVFTTSQSTVYTCPGLLCFNSLCNAEKTNKRVPSFKEK